jgi:hypothetical protein
MSGPLGGAADGSISAHHYCWRRRRWWALWEVLPPGRAAPTTILLMFVGADFVYMSVPAWEDIDSGN